MDSLPFAERASVPSNHAHFFPTEARVLDRHAEERVFIFLVIGCEGILVEQNRFRVIRASFRELWKLPSDRGDQAGLSLHVRRWSSCYENSRFCIWASSTGAEHSSSSLPTWLIRVLTG